MRLLWALRKLLDPSNDFDVALHRDRRVKAQLTAPRYMTIGGKYRAEPKAKTKERMGQTFTMDDLDAILMTLFVIEDTPGAWRLKGGKHRRLPVRDASEDPRVLSPLANRGIIRRGSRAGGQRWMGR